MQDFRWRSDYGGIFMVWCAGYLGRSDLINFLRKAKARLAQDSSHVTRNSPPQSFIYLLDNVLEDDEEPEIIKGQMVRSEELLEDIFKEAGLLIHKRSEREPMPGRYRDVRVWALY